MDNDKSNAFFLKANKNRGTIQLSSKTVEYIGLATAHTKSLDDKYSISQRALKYNATYSIQEKAVEAATKVQEFGDNWSGARVSPAVAYLTDLAKQGYATGVERVNLVVDVVTTQAAEQNAASEKTQEIVQEIVVASEQ